MKELLDYERTLNLDYEFRYTFRDNYRVTELDLPETKPYLRPWDRHTRYMDKVDLDLEQIREST